ncbi:21352_t:CDS:2, partial [Dentiscutata erythropus]
FSGPSSLQMSKTVGNVPVPAVIFFPGSSPIINISCLDTTVTYDCSNNLINYTDYIVYFSNSSFSSTSTVLFLIYTVDLNSSTYPYVTLLDSATYTKYNDYFIVSGSISLKGSKTSSNIQDKLSSLLYENYYTLSPFQWNYIFLDRIQYQDLEISSEQAMFTKVASKSSQHRVKYFGLSTRMFPIGQYSNADFPNVTIPYTLLQISNMSTILTTYTQVNKVSSTTVAGFLSGLG